MKKKPKKKVAQVKPLWKNVYDSEYREYFITQAQLSKSVRKDGIAYLTFYDEQIVPLQGKTKKPVVERKIRTTLVIPEKALARMAKFLSRIVDENSKLKEQADSQANEEHVKEEVLEESGVKQGKVETTYIR